MRDFAVISPEFIPVSFVGGDEFGMLDPINCPLTTLLWSSPDSEEIENVKFRVREDQERNLSDTLTAGVTAVDTVFPVTTGTRFRTGEVLRVDNELVKIQSISSNNLTVARAIAGTAAIHAISAPVVNLGMIEPDGWEPGSTFDNNPSSYEQYLGNLSEPFETNTNIMNTRLLTWEDFQAAYPRQKFRDFQIQAERAYWRSIKGETVQSGRTLRTFDGIEARVTSNITPVGGVLTEAIFNGFVEDVFAEGGSTIWLWCDSPYTNALQTIYGTKIERIPQDEVAKVRVSVIQHTEGDIIIARHKRFPSMNLGGVAFALKMNRVKQAWQKGMGLGVIPVPNTSPHVKKWEWTLTGSPTVARPAEHGKMTGAT